MIVIEWWLFIYDTLICKGKTSSLRLCIWTNTSTNLLDCNHDRVDASFASGVCREKACFASRCAMWHCNLLSLAASIHSCWSIHKSGAILCYLQEAVSMFAHSRRRHKYHLSELHLVADFAVNQPTYQDVVCRRVTDEGHQVCIAVSLSKSVCPLFGVNLSGGLAIISR